MKHFRRLSVSFPRNTSSAGYLLSLFGCFSLFGCSLTIILLAGAAGWTGGQRLAKQTASVQEQIFINENCALFAEDVLESRPVFLQRRYEILASLTPAPPCIASIPVTATSLAERLSNEAIPTDTPTVVLPSATPVTPSLTITSQATPIPTHDLETLAQQLEVARQAIREQNHQGAIDLLEAIHSADPSFDPSTVNALLLFALRLRAAFLFSAGELAQAILLVNRAEEFGLPNDDSLRFSRWIATYYLDALRWKDIDVRRAIQNLEALRSLAPDYAPTGQPSALSLLAELHATYGEILLVNQDACAAVSQFELALNYGAVNAGINSKLTTARENCSNGVPASETPN